MFSIRFADEPLMQAELDKGERVGLIVLGRQEERFAVHMGPWSKRNYIVHWSSALSRVLRGKPSALITDMRTPVQSSHLVWWPMWRINSEIVFHNQLLFFADHKVQGSRVDVKGLYEFIGNRVPHNNEGAAVSEWVVRVSDVERFLDSPEIRRGMWPVYSRL
jgi:hypothetical protein